ncbi:substrate-binding domain-containing protein [Humisphaera borealis]|uniref:Helix-turn-helix domain-containing protein n=1 Tax=Humisphaera borealis TaxID=2807512 RepID=A0A7M2WU43_9BACT|nr:substrate-binding domain-containing protein [Humisphaera borealis]QOV88969.1 helix-turn-helix domain-containing protein [Humisphaera borealis]
MKPRRVALLVETSSSWGVQIIAGVRDYVREHERWVLYVDHRGSYERQNVPTWCEGDGIIARVMAPALVQHVRLNKIPCVNVSQVRVPDAVLQHVTGDEPAIGALAAETLLRTGAEYYVYYGPPKRDYYTDRLGAAYVRRVEQEGFDVTVIQPDRLLRTDTNPHYNQLELADWLTALPRPVGILTWNAIGAFRLLETAAWAGVRVPEDGVSLLSGDLDELLTRISQPRMAAIDHNPWQVGYEAARHLDRLMRGGAIGPEVLVPMTGLVAGETLPNATHADPLIRKALQHMASRLAVPLSVPALATATGVSRRTLELRFRQVMGSSPALEVRRLRVEQACRMLKAGDQPISEIAAACGFTAVELLQRAMQKQVGMTPTEFRASQGRKGSKSL